MKLKIKKYEGLEAVILAGTVLSIAFSIASLFQNSYERELLEKIARKLDVK